VKLLVAGVPLAAGTDAPYPGVFQGEGLHRELELLVAAGLTPLQALRLATYDAARVLQADGEWGSLRPGLKADVLVVAGRPHERISDTRRIDVVIQGGRRLERAALRFDIRRDGGHRAVPGLFNP
jgi:imidazolonepropionase-like amidohydrolase